MNPLANREIDNKKQSISKFIRTDQRVKNIALVVVIGIFIGFLAPFGMNHVSPIYSISYWVITCLVGYGIYSPIINLVETKTLDSISTQWHRVAVGALIASIFMSFAVPVLTYWFFEQPINLLRQFPETFPKTIMIGGMITVVTVIRDLLEKRTIALEESQQALASSQQVTQDVLDKDYEAFMSQIPVEKRGDLLCLEMSDHYLKVYTDKGHHMLLMRFKDALSKLESFPGLQTHRSWWVAKSAIVKVNKDGRKLQLTLSNDVIVPVSRTYEETIKNEGFSL